MPVTAEMVDVIKADINKRAISIPMKITIFLEINILINFKHLLVFGRESIKSIDYKKSNR